MTMHTFLTVDRDDDILDTTLFDDEPTMADFREYVGQQDQPDAVARWYDDGEVVAEAAEHFGYIYYGSED